MRTFTLFETLWQDACYAARTLRKSPAFLAVVVLSLALGIGANSTIFSVLNTVLYRPLPYRQPDRLMTIWESESGRPNSEEHPPIADAADWRRQSHVFEDIALTSFTEPTPLAGDGGAEQAGAQFVTPNFFRLLRVSPMIGRVFTANEAQDLTQTVVISDAFWKRRFNSDPKVLGRSLKISGVLPTVVGVMPPSFGSFFGDRLDLWVPIDAGSARYSERKDHWLMAMARMNYDHPEAAFVELMQLTQSPKLTLRLDKDPVILPDDGVPYGVRRSEMRSLAESGLLKQKASPLAVAFRRALRLSQPKGWLTLRPAEQQGSRVRWTKSAPAGAPLYNVWALAPSWAVLSAR